MFCFSKTHINNQEFLEEWGRDYDLFKQKKLNRHDLALKYRKSNVTIGNWIKCYSETGFPYKTLTKRWNEHGVKIIGIRKFMLELNHYFNQHNGDSLYIYYDKDQNKIWFQAKPRSTLKPFFLLETAHSLYISEIYTLICKKYQH